jgi:periplasmic protein TonB
MITKPRSPRQKLVAIAAAAGVQVLAVLALVAPKVVVTHPPAVAMMASFVDSPATAEPVPAEMKPPLETVEMPAAVMPDVVIALSELSPLVITFVAAPAAARLSPPVMASSEPTVQASFDADYLKNPPPVYPLVSKRLREQGTVVLKVWVNAQGGGETLLIYRSSGSARLDDAALAAVRHWRFVPAKRGEDVVESWVLVPIEFEFKA